MAKPDVLGIEGDDDRPGRKKEGAKGTAAPPDEHPKKARPRSGGKKADESLARFDERLSAFDERLRSLAGSFREIEVRLCGLEERAQGLNETSTEVLKLEPSLKKVLDEVEAVKKSLERLSKKRIVAHKRDWPFVVLLIQLSIVLGAGSFAALRWLVPRIPWGSIEQYWNSLVR